MKCMAWISATALCVGLFANGAAAQGLRQPLSVNPAGFDYAHFLNGETASETAGAVAGQQIPVMDPVVQGSVQPSSQPVHAAGVPAATSSGGCGPSCAPSCSTPSCGAASSCAPSCGTASCGGCSSCNSCSCGNGCSLDGLVGECCLGDAWTLSSQLFCENSPWSVGGWIQAGYHSESNDLFNSHPDQVNLHQAWLYIEKAAEPTCGGLDWGMRADFVYGVDAQDTQAFGNNAGEWDFLNGFDHGIYGWAIPQLYGEIASDNGWSIKAGHFFTLVGYEVVTAPDNFFYSHAITMYNSEPFTHTGVLGSYSVSDNLEVYAGWTLGWDTGFDQFGDGSSWLGGFSATLTDDITFTYISTAGDFGARGDDAYSHSMVLDTQLSDKVNYVFQSDLVRVSETGEDNVGINQYMFYTVNDCLGLGARLEWWKGDNVTGYAPHGAVLPNNGSFSYYAATVGANVKPHANLVVRPEIRFDWSPAGDYDETTVGIDAYITF